MILKQHIYYFIGHLQVLVMVLFCVFTYMVAVGDVVSYWVVLLVRRLLVYVFVLFSVTCE